MAKIHYCCEDCGHEWLVDGPPIKVRTCVECGGRAEPVPEEARYG